MHKRVFAIAAILALCVAPAQAQNLTPDDVADAYVEAVALCARAKVAGVGVAQLGEEDRARVAEAAPQMRTMARVPDGRPVWDVLSARGIVIISEPTETECDVTAYGPRVRPVFDRTAEALTAANLGFSEIETPQTPSAITRVFERNHEGRSVSILLDGGEPGMPGRTFRFPMLLAFVRGS